MLSSFFSGISGLIANSSSINVVGNNIANVNTVGFKASRATFEDVLYQSISGTSGSSQVGRGTGRVRRHHIRSGHLSTSESTDPPSRRGFFMVRSEESETKYIRAGQPVFDADGTQPDQEGDINDECPYGVDTDISYPRRRANRVTEFIGMNEPPVRCRRGRYPGQLERGSEQSVTVWL